MKKTIVSVLFCAAFVCLLIPAHQALAKQVDIAIQDDYFNPFAPMIQPGDTVTWTNAGQMPHTVTADDNSFDSGPLQPGASFTQTFTTGSVINYYCKIHSTPSSQGGNAMNAVILINPTAPGAGSSGYSSSPTPVPTPTSTSTPGLAYTPGLQMQMPMAPAPVPVNTNPYPTGTLINDSGTIYLTIGSTKVPFTNMAAFKGLGYSLKNVISADSSAFNPSMTYTINSAKQAHPWSSWLSYKGVVYYSHESGMIGVPSMNVLSANGGTTILPMNQADIEVLNSSSGIPILEMMDSRLY